VTDLTTSVCLRKPLPSDAVARMALGISAGIVRMFGAVTESQPVMGKRQADRWLRGLVKHPNAWVIEVNGTLVGEVRLDGLDPQDRRARLAIGLFNDQHLGLGIGRRAIRLLLEQAFGPLGLHRVDLRVLAYNERAIRCYQACGFVREGVERGSARIGDEWHDDWIMAIPEDGYRRASTSG
jgi:[ribosomal protein S5]-alanine N-acetyltransferase